MIAPCLAGGGHRHRERRSEARGWLEHRDCGLQKPRFRLHPASANAAGASGHRVVVTMALIHGGQPDALILCHEPTREHMRGLPSYALPKLKQLRDMVLPIAKIANPSCKIVGISVNTQHMAENEAKAYLDDLENRLGLPTTDPFRYGGELLVDALDKV